MELSAGAGVRRIQDEDAARAVWPVMGQLRTHLSERAFLDQVALQRHEGYRLAAVFDLDGSCRTVAGYRIQTMLWRGRTLYVDDLVSDQAVRGQGHARALLDWLCDEARSEGCTGLHLDSGVQRLEAHAFYFRRGLRISAYHFSIDV
ncbi:MAG TPA: GNAT family N-acetyltransferase [Xanthomonadaceae bacterium]|nr:GNAT family N-acetyltransferase [Xanthomonadaceae bacterium]